MKPEPAVLKRKLYVTKRFSKLIDIQGNIDELSDCENGTWTTGFTRLVSSTGMLQSMWTDSYLDSLSSPVQNVSHTRLIWISNVKAVKLDVEMQKMQINELKSVLIDFQSKMHENDREGQLLPSIYLNQKTAVLEVTISSWGKLASVWTQRVPKIC